MVCSFVLNQGITAEFKIQNTEFNREVRPPTWVASKAIAKGEGNFREKNRVNTCFQDLACVVH
ncbi:MAG: hypothetical protein RMZ69_21680 [Nostoc sp. ChiQUE01a]|nr:hypothetical protein [Nostoc sp. ChiQUE01a]